MAAPDRAFIRALPKAELHCHLDGSLRPATLLEMVRDEGGHRLNATTPQQLADELGLGKRHDSLESYLKAFDLTLAFMQQREPVGRIVAELVDDAADEGITHLEVRYAADLHTRLGLSMAQVHETVLAALCAAGARRDITVSLINCGIRHFPPQQTAMSAAVAAMYRDQVASGFDLAGPEHGFPPSLHREAFDIARRHGLPVTVHAGEAAGPGSVWDALLTTGASRIGHGVALKDDPLLLNYCADRGVAVEVCLTSNLQTAAVQTLADHPLPALLDHGVKAVLCTDNRLVSNTTLTDEYLLAVNTFGLDYPQVLRLALNGFEAAFLPHAARRRAVLRAVRAMEKLVAQFGLSASVLSEITTPG